MLKSRKRGNSDLAHIPGEEGQGFPYKITRGVPYFGFDCIFIITFFENLPQGVLCYTPFAFLCIYVIILNEGGFYKQTNHPQSTPFYYFALRINRLSKK
jgi:hypothetical protein